MITIYTARCIHTMNASNPTAAAIGVSDGRIVGVGTVDELAGWGDHVIDDRFADQVIVPGFVEAHAHAMSGGLEQFPFVGRFDRRTVDGSVRKGCADLDSVVERLREAEAAMPPGEHLVAFGLDPIYFSGERLSARHLDQVSETRPVAVFHASLHLATVNTAMLRAAGLTADSTTHGIVKGPDGEPNGELQELPAMSLIPNFGALFARIGARDAVRAFGASARAAGITTLTDLATALPTTPEREHFWVDAVDDSYPVRLVPFPTFRGGHREAAEFAESMRDLQSRRTAKLWWGGVKLVLDGSIQGWTAQVGSPGYRTRSHDGWWGLSPETVPEVVHTLHAAGLQLHAHCNGDLTSGLFIDAVGAALDRTPRWDHRHTVTHGQLTTPAQYRRMRALGMGVNLFSNHLLYWGDQHAAFTVGPERARGMNAAATALREGVPFTLHSDAPVTPLGGLHLMWCAVNRLTASGQVLGEHERIGVDDALRAITLGGAYLLKMDHLIGSLEAGKYADFTVLGEDPYEVDPVSLKDIPVVATAVDGEI